MGNARIEPEGAPSQTEMQDVMDQRADSATKPNPPASKRYSLSQANGRTMTTQQSGTTTVPRKKTSEDAFERRKGTLVQRRGSVRDGVFQPAARAKHNSDPTPEELQRASNGNVDGDLAADASAVEVSYLTEPFTSKQLRWLILPYSKLRTCWDCFTLALVMYTAISLPIFLSFVPDDYTIPSGLREVELAMDFIFIVDIILNFNTALVGPDATLVINKRAIARQYSAKWLPVDAAASVPWEIIFLIANAASGGSAVGDEGASNLEGVQFVKILKVPKLLRLGRLFKFLERFEGAANVGRIFALVVVMVLLIHWLASVWYLLAKRDGMWLATVCAEPVAAGESCSRRLDDADLLTRYAFTYYYTMLMIMGDNTSPTDSWEVLFAVIVVLVGSCINATIFANVAHLVAQLSAASAQHQRKMDGVTAALHRLKVAPATAKRIRAYFEYRWQRHHDHAGDEFVKGLPQQLHTRVSMVVHESKIRACPIFVDADRRLVAAFATMLQPEVYLPSEYVLVAGYVSRCMYFVASGRVQLIMCEGRGRGDLTIQCFERTDYFDELGLFTERRADMSARAVTHTDLYKLARDDFAKVIHEYPGPGIKLADAASKHMNAETAAIIQKRVYELAGMEKLALAFTRQAKLDGKKATEKFDHSWKKKRAASPGAGDDDEPPTVLGGASSPRRGSKGADSEVSAAILATQREMQQELRSLSVAVAHIARLLGTTLPAVPAFPPGGPPAPPTRLPPPGTAASSPREEALPRGVDEAGGERDAVQPILSEVEPHEEPIDEPQL